MSKAYEKLLKKMDRSTSIATVDPQIAALQARFSAIVDGSKKDILGEHSDDDDEDQDEDDLDEDHELDEDNEFGDEDDFDEDGLDDFDEDGEEETGAGGDQEEDSGIDLFAPASKSSKNEPKPVADATTATTTKQPKNESGLEGVDEEEIGDEDDELNIFEYDWDVERDESDSELDGNDDEDDEDRGDEEVDHDNKKTKANTGKTPQAKKEAKPAATLSLYDQYFNNTLTPTQIKILEAQSEFAPPQSDQIGLVLRQDISDSDLLKQLRRTNKYNPYGRSGISNSMVDDDEEIDIPTRQMTMVNNVILRTGSLLDPYNIHSAQHQDPNLDLAAEEAEVEFQAEKLTAVQVGAQQLQIMSDRQSRLLSPLPEFPSADSKYPVDQYGDGLIVTAGKQRRQIEKTEDNGTWKRSGYTKAQLKKMKHQSDKIPKMAMVRTVPSFKSLGFKQRLAEHITQNALVSPTAYETMRNAYIHYSSDQTQYEFITNRMIKVETEKTSELLQDHNMLLPSYQHDVQSTFASVLSTYTDCLFAPPIPSPNQQIDWFIYRDVYLLHIINHVLTHRDRIVSHNEALYRRDARAKEENFIRSLGAIADKDERMAALEKHLDELHDMMENPSFSPQQQQDAQARLAVLTNSHKTRVHIKRLNDQAELEKLNKEKDSQDQLLGPKFTPKNRKISAKEQERIAIQERAAADLEFQQKMSNLKLTKARQQLRTLSAADSDSATAPVPSPSLSTTLNTSDHSDKYRDQGFTRATVLILAPSKLHAYTIVSRLIELLPPQQTKRMVNDDRFHTEYGDSDREYTAANNKPLDYNLNFNGNNEDSFYFGIQFNGNGLKLFASLYQADIIIASPLGLKLIVGNEGMRAHDRKADFLSSIEISVIDQLQLIMNQNMDHLTDVLHVVNGIPSKTQNIDFSRIRPSVLNGHARFYRQNIWLSAMLTPQLQFLFQRYCENKNGSIRLRPSEYSPVAPYFKLPPGTLKQTFYRVDLNSVTTAALTAASRSKGDDKKPSDTIFDKKLHVWFTDIWPRIKDWYNAEGCTMIFVPSSYDFVRIRNAMEEKFVDYMIISEYTDQRMIDSAKTRIAQGTAKFLLVSERFWVFNRSTFYGIKHIVWYGLPTTPQAYIDFINYIKQTGNTQRLQVSTAGASGAQTVQASTVKNLSVGNASSSLVKSMSTSIATTKQPTSFVVYTQHDAMALERIVGTEFARELLLAGDNIHVLQ